MNWRTQILAGIGQSTSPYFSDERHFAPPEGGFVDAAVLIAITQRDEPGVIFTQRPASLRKHAGQIAFPGGKVDPEDSGPVDAALREAEEEIGLPREKVEIIGETDVYYTGSGYRIVPVIAAVPADLILTPNPDEVVDWFEVPLSFLLNPESAKVESGMWEGQPRQYYDIQWHDRRIWGVTAGIIVNLTRRIAL